jgi:hypothetical protein
MLQTEHLIGSSKVLIHPACSIFQLVIVVVRVEESLQEAKESVRRKLGLASDVVIHLEQLRAGTTIDLEDGESFDKCP